MFDGNKTLRSNVVKFCFRSAVKSVQLEVAGDNVAPGDAPVVVFESDVMRGRVRPSRRELPLAKVCGSILFVEHSKKKQKITSTK